MKIVLLFFSLVFVSSAFPSTDLELVLDPSQMIFRLSTQDGERTYPCTFKAANPWGYDWNVTCGDLTNFTRSYGVHLLANRYTSPNPPKMKYEILYWVTARDLAFGHGRYMGSTTWFKLNDPAALTSLEVAQEVEEIWNLEIEMKLNGATRAINPNARRRFRP